ncbi:MAG: sulfate ABC transporter ATP-binding protein [Sulfuricurvum sp. GWF2_44_89]|uniref:Sulfate ABC transporter ATP-binding protein n=1 Tax=Sulfuricurvum kujiense TaxID=148813 RepID=A0A2D3WBK5_9BACT|nr:MULTISPECIES: ATP-binding cassette domain-containing protein [Sulfuricurvum]OHD79605.1 MAG: sulfate ABC transporter ATP-binding protein [Sulfuricurvum sp. GWF2_44_89]OHD91950.1 MAG: sulfate ABC transporter ATP-binding protein [Sulfuricurvum sp. RIFOXYD2_FULL_44_160]OHD94058.1 MAG: sulfate ABC transporter ATP-binding protein [Sulfuricurvum sp. RIFOXYD12_FULL_44_77]DAB38691.1 MAG TPA: sulfate ABC transporter ATP-binding protein [Sulfuricurvum kujiense]
MNHTIIDVRNVVTAFGENLIHDHISCTVRENEIYALLGGSGSGKSTLMREMILLERPQSGTIHVLGHDLSTLTPLEAAGLRRSWGVLFQSGALYSSLTVGENIALLYNEYTDLSPKLVDELIRLKINLVGLPPHAKYLYPSQLSGGMIKRAALARALALDPKLLFLDEPTSGLDPLSSRQFDTLIQQLRDLLGLTIIMVTHDLDTIHHIVDRFTLLGEKKAIAEGSLEEVLAIEHPIVDYFFQKGSYGITC